jgi:hypothetical protein
MTDAPGRVAIRFRPQVGATAELGHFDNHNNFITDKAALVINESFGGCCLVVIDDDKLANGASLLLRFPPLDPMKINIIWKQPLAENLVRLGIQYAEE